jgi:hypothetical protein
MNVFVLVSMSTGTHPRVELNFDCFFLTHAWVITSIVHITSSLLKPEDFSRIVSEMHPHDQLAFCEAVFRVFLGIFDAM